ncbi:MAG: hypothetical protein KAS75_05600 [Planctomycetes bacterium]|nr:hypothetical protein [Planctomycetota bacterium]
MAVLVGIDEAGFGPILGPLVVSSSTFSLPDNLIKADLWRVLTKSVGKRRRHLAGRLLVADSKKSYSRSAGIKHLERTVISCLKCLGSEPSTLPELLGLLCPDCIGRLENYPWYKDIGGYNISADGADVAIASSVFGDELKSKGIELVDMRSYCLDVGYYNKMVESVRNKSSVLFTTTSALIKRAFDKFSGEEIQVMVDRQGGRVHYRTVLQRMFPNMELEILKETTHNSSYQLQADGKRMRLHFVVGADERFFPVSLASMVSKYLRELLVGNINRYFASFHAQLKPTAGYWKDGLRFIEDLKKHVPHVQYDSEQLIRSR